MIRKVFDDDVMQVLFLYNLLFFIVSFEVDPMTYPKYGGQTKVVAFITDYQAVDRIIDHLKLTFVAENPPPSHVDEQVALIAAEGQTEYF